jgi:hyperpolarization activated cyclic nucleotide-gated potassium channel 2
MGDITKYMKKAKIPTELQNRVRRYLEYIWDTERNLKLQDLVKNLSNDLRHTLLLEVNGNMISYCDILFGLFSNQLLLELTQILSEETIFPQEFVFKEIEEEYQEKSIYFIQSGEVEILYEKTDMILATKSVSGGNRDNKTQ